MEDKSAQKAGSGTVQSVQDRVRGAILGEAILNLAQLTALSKLPTREVLLAKVAGAFNAPAQQTVFLFAAPLQKLGRAFGALAAKKSAEAA